MSPPSYADLGKEAYDILHKGYHFCWWKFVCNTIANGIEVNTNGYCQEGTGDVLATFELKYYYDLFDFMCIGKYTSGNVISLGIDSPVGWMVKRLKLDYCFDLGPTFRNATQKIKINYGGDNLKVDSNISIDEGGMYMLSSAVFQFKKYLFGYTVNYDVLKDQLDNHNFALGRITDDLRITLNVCDKDQEFAGKIYTRWNQKLEMGIFGSISVLTGGFNIGIGSKYQMSDKEIFQCMLLTPMLFGLSYQRKVNENITVCVSTLIDVYYFKLKMGATFELALDLKKK